MNVFLIGLIFWDWVDKSKRRVTRVKIHILNDAGQRLSDGSSIGYAIVAALQTWIAMIGPAMTAQQWAMLAATVIGWAFKFVRVEW